MEDSGVYSTSRAFINTKRNGCVGASLTNSHIKRIDEVLQWSKSFGRKHVPFDMLRKVSIDKSSLSRYISSFPVNCLPLSNGTLYNTHIWSATTLNINIISTNSFLKLTVHALLNNEVATENRVHAKLWPVERLKIPEADDMSRRMYSAARKADSPETTRNEPARRRGRRRQDYQWKQRNTYHSYSKIYR